MISDMKGEVENPVARRELREEENLGLYTMASAARATWRIKEGSLAKSTR